MSVKSHAKYFIKKILRSFFVRLLLSSLATFYLIVVNNTTKWKSYNAQIMKNAWNGSGPVIVVFWHEKLLLMTNSWKSREPFHMLISNHADGKIVANTISWFGISTVYGSSSRGGVTAIKMLVKKIQSGSSIGITPDGPRGPKRVLSDGALFIASLSGATIIPSSSAIKNHLVLNTWDQLEVPLPFSTGARVWGNPITVPRKCSGQELERLKIELDSSLHQVTKKSNGLVNNIVVDQSNNEDT